MNGPGRSETIRPAFLRLEAIMMIWYLATCIVLAIVIGLIAMPDKWRR